MNAMRAEGRPFSEIGPKHGVTPQRASQKVTAKPPPREPRVPVKLPVSVRTRVRSFGRLKESHDPLGQKVTLAQAITALCDVAEVALSVTSSYSYVPAPLRRV